MSADNAVITVDGLCKAYASSSLFRRKKSSPVLKNVSFTVNKGESLAVIGRNGVGKSTLLKLLAGILTPDSGTIVRATDQVSLLALGGGLIPDCSGRANAVMLMMMQQGMTRKEAEERVDDVLAFAELGEYADAPVRLYSSGMQSRLKFAVATQVRSDLLLVDEVLAVGDIAFREKSAAEMRSKLESGDTIVWVSHVLTEVVRLCDRALWL
jgi:lipopolysaccharide transport system ATP-binding protein